MYSDGTIDLRRFMRAIGALGTKLDSMTQNLVRRNDQHHEENKQSARNVLERVSTEQPGRGRGCGLGRGQGRGGGHHVHGALKGGQGRVQCDRCQEKYSKSYTSTQF